MAGGVLGVLTICSHPVRVRVPVGKDPRSSTNNGKYEYESPSSIDFNYYGAVRNGKRIFH